MEIKIILKGTPIQTLEIIRAIIAVAGANKLQTFWKITVPMLKPTIGSVADPGLYLHL